MIHLRSTPTFDTIIEQVAFGCVGRTALVDHFQDCSPQLRRIKSRLDLAFEVERKQAVCRNTLINVHLEPAEHDRNKACWIQHVALKM